MAIINEVRPATNVEFDNDYNGLDRGLFLIRDGLVTKYARISSATWEHYGPNGSTGLLKFKVMTYNAVPTAANYSKGSLMKNPVDGSDTFTVITTGPAWSPILAEYWGKTAMINHYIPLSVALVSDLNKEDIKVTGAMLSKAKCGYLGVEDVTTTVTYVGTAKPLAISNVKHVVKMSDPKKNFTVDTPLADINRKYCPLDTVIKHLSK